MKPSSRLWSMTYVLQIYSGKTPQGCLMVYPPSSSQCLPPRSINTCCTPRTTMSPPPGPPPLPVEFVLVDLPVPVSVGLVNHLLELLVRQVLSLKPGEGGRGRSEADMRQVLSLKQGEGRRGRSEADMRQVLSLQQGEGRRDQRVCLCVTSFRACTRDHVHVRACISTRPRINS